METQGEVDENGLPGPGAPTPLSALEVCNRPRTNTTASLRDMGRKGLIFFYRDLLA